jgi:NitT/TauT family transport system ATP-binding protein
MQEELLQIWERDRKTVLFVTHSIDEAILLADRCVVMSARPGQISEIEEIEIPRPRSRADESSPNFIETKARLWDHLRALQANADERVA